MAGWFKTPLITEHLRLRPAQPGDEEWIIKLFTDPEVRKYVGGAMSEAGAREVVQISETWWGHFAILDREHGRAIGSVSFENKLGFWEISYSLQRQFWGRGLATEAISAAILW